MTTNTTLANERIRTPTVRLIDQHGENKGEVKTRDALEQAYRAGLDLVAINQTVSPMVVKILDLAKYVFEQKKLAKERARKSRENEVHLKEIQLRPVTDSHDVGIKAANARKFLDDNCKVKVVVKFRGREMSYRDLGFDVIRNFLGLIGEHKFEREPSMQGNSITAILVPSK